MGVRNSVTVRDRGANRVVRAVTSMSGPVALQVGVMGKAAEAKHNVRQEDGTITQGDQTVAEVAASHELGLGVPERSWLRGWFDEHQAEIREDLAKIQRGVLLGRFTREQGLEILGVKYVGQIQARMATSIPPPNAPSTIKRKGSSVTLVDTGQMRSAVTYALEKLARAAGM